MSSASPAVRGSRSTRGVGIGAIGCLVAALLAPVQAASFGDSPGGLPGSSPGIALGVRYDSLLDEVGYAPNADGGGFLDARTRQRFTGAAVSLSRADIGRASLGLTLGSYRLVTLRDELQIDGVRAHAGWRLSAADAPLRMRVLFDVSMNRSDAFDKNSWTELDGATLTRTRIAEPRDLQASIGLGAHRDGPLGAMLGGFARLGATRVSHDEVTGTGRDDDGCRYDVAASRQRASITLAEPCGRVLDYSEVYPDERGLNDRYGIAPSRDLDWQALWIEVGAGTLWSGERLSVALDWRYRHYRRDGIDERIEASGGTARRAAHVLSFKTGWAFTQRLSIGAGVDWRVAPWLDELPLMYNRYTAHRQDTRLPSFRLSLTRRFGPRG